MQIHKYWIQCLDISFLSTSRFNKYIPKILGPNRRVIGNFFWKNWRGGCFSRFLLNCLKIIFDVSIVPKFLKIEKQLVFDVLKGFGRSYSTCVQCAREKICVGMDMILWPKNPVEFPFWSKIKTFVDQSIFILKNRWMYEKVSFRLKEYIYAPYMIIIWIFISS